MLSAMRVLLGPALLWQGKKVRKKILRMPEPDGPRNGMIGSGPPLSLLILGDSSAAGVGTENQAQALSGQLTPRLAGRFTLSWTLHAQTGWTTQDALDALDDVRGQAFDLAIISLGVNDVTTETGLKAWLKIYRQLVERLVSDHKVEKFIFSGLPPMGRFPALPHPLRWYLGQQAIAHDKAMGTLAKDIDGAVHLPLNFDDMDESAVAEDGFHPGPPIYARWARDLDETIRGLIE